MAPALLLGQPSKQDMRAYWGPAEEEIRICGTAPNVGTLRTGDVNVEWCTRAHHTLEFVILCLPPSVYVCMMDGQGSVKHPSTCTCTCLPNPQVSGHPENSGMYIASTHGRYAGTRCSKARVQRRRVRRWSNRPRVLGRDNLMTGLTGPHVGKSEQVWESTGLQMTGPHLRWASVLRQDIQQRWTRWTRWQDRCRFHGDQA
ncbi:hypothetical protein F5Y15DRAFT_260856 [Xylariaceae sp. FL0016]|nr:hypothetical protein F5Y15DRAFT_260856 [Xylariaceae sp. FL0016]